MMIVGLWKDNGVIYTKTKTTVMVKFA